MIQVNIHEAKTHFSRLIQQAVDGEEIVVAKGNIPVAKLVALNPPAPKRRLGTAKGRIQMAPDFDKPLDDFKEYAR
jgi:prevent-host-death family protein